MDVKSLKTALAHVEQRATGTRYGREVRSAVAAYLEQRVAAGASGAEVGRELGLHMQTLWRWAREERAAPAFRAVEVAASRGGGELVVHAGRVRIEGLDLDGVVELVRRLS